MRLLGARLSLLHNPQKLSTDKTRHATVHMMGTTVDLIPKKIIL